MHQSAGQQRWCYLVVVYVGVHTAHVASQSCVTLSAARSCKELKAKRQVLLAHVKEDILRPRQFIRKHSYSIAERAASVWPTDVSFTCILGVAQKKITPAFVRRP